MVPLVGYIDRISGRPGERIAVTVSSQCKEDYRADLVRIIHADPNPDGPGLKLEPIPCGFAGMFASRHQPVLPGSYGVIEASLALVEGGAFLSVVRHISDRVAVMYLGRVVEQGDKRSLYGAPLHPYTQALIAAVPALSPAGRRERRARRARMTGDIPSAMAISTGCRFHTRCPHVMPICRADDPVLTPEAPGHDVACHLFSRSAV